ncbi:penicillin acylase family protein [Shewanella maritima]|uniref:penicillin acylase family protein n=1 Tax=Shewanella maritima TaxID=2520507 RepID=UPI001F5F0771|nr:penicillin acylase family protein [Shewanella maritima]
MANKIITITKFALSSVIGLALLVIVALLAALYLSLPKLSDSISAESVANKVTINRDNIGTAIISAISRADAAYGLGYAHGQDRFFQMDLLRRNAAGELSQIFGDKALKLDKKRRFHQFRKRALAIVESLPVEDKTLLDSYSKGVNAALAKQSVHSFEYLLTNTRPAPWQAEDSLLVIFSMYLDLQSNTVTRDLTLTQIQQQFGYEMVEFLIQPSPYQAALDGSELALKALPIPSLKHNDITSAQVSKIESVELVGSNNWAVSGALTESGHGMVSDDMHLSFAVPIIWYRAQLNYVADSDIFSADKANKPVQVTGVSLPGAPAIVVGTNNSVAWGFTNAYIDTADWVKLNGEPTYTVEEIITSKDGEHIYQLEMSDYGPVKTIGDDKYALSWVAHQAYAVDMGLIALEQVSDVTELSEAVVDFGMPVQNIVAADKYGSIAWKLSGAIPSRMQPADTAINADKFNADAWLTDETNIPEQINPAINRIWTANSRVVSATEHQRMGDGGYALGARASQIRDGMFAKKRFDEQDFYQLQLDNQAQFLTPWHRYLVTHLEQDSQTFIKDLKQLREWQGCACKESVGYTLVKYFRQEMIDRVFAPVETKLQKHGLSLSVVKRYLEPAIWQLIRQESDDWLPAGMASWEQLTVEAYQDARNKLLAKYSDGQQLTDLAWGKVNALKVQHPFSKQVPILSKWLDMPTHAGFGDTFMPSVQGASFGASQRFIVQPGFEENGILTVPGGQSGHPMSDYYRSGFNDYVNQRHTPLMPGAIVHSIDISPKP